MPEAEWVLLERKQKYPHLLNRRKALHLQKSQKEMAEAGLLLKAYGARLAEAGNQQVGRWNALQELKGAWKLGECWLEMTGLKQESSLWERW